MAIDELTYPQPVLDRTGPAPSIAAAGAVAAAPTPPISRVIPFVMSATANNRQAHSSGPYKGPAVVTGVHFAKSGTAHGVQGIVLGKSASPVSENNVPHATTKPWTRLFEPILLNTGAAVGESSDTSTDQSLNSTLSNDAHLGIVILDKEFHLVIAIASGGVGSDVFAGHVTLLEQVNPAALANFL